MMRLFITFLCSSILLSCASRPKYKEVDVEAELRQNSKEFTARNPESAAPWSGQGVQNFSPANSKTRTVQVEKPSIMALPAATQNLNQSLEVLQSNPMARAAENAIQGYLTQKMYTVISVEGNSQINDIVNIQNEIAGMEDDLSYISSLSLGADVYIKFSYDIHRGQILANLGAYESSSGRMLGSQTATVNDNGTRKEELVTSAMHKAMPGLEKKILAYFEADSKIGVPYKVILKFPEEAPDADDLQMRIASLLKRTFNKVTVNAMTDKTGDFTVYADAKKITDAYEVYDEIRTTLSPLSVKKNSIIQKLLILEVNE